MVKKLSCIPLIYFISLAFWQANAQSLSTTICGTDKQMEIMYKHNANALLESNALRKKVSRLKKSKVVGSYVIPVVFHVFGTEFNNGTTVTQAIIEEALQKTNEDFQGLAIDYNTIDAPFDAIKQPLNITFKLAKLDSGETQQLGLFSMMRLRVWEITVLLLCHE